MILGPSLPFQTVCVAPTSCLPPALMAIEPAPRLPSPKTTPSLSTMLIVALRPDSPGAY